MSFGEENFNFVELKPDLQNVQIKTEAVDYSNEFVSVKQEISEIAIPNLSIKEENFEYNDLEKDPLSINTTFDNDEKSEKHIKTESIHKYKNQCNRCGKSFSRAGDLKKHVEFVHEGVKKHKCDPCNKAFSTAQTLKRHMSSLHKGLKEYECEICGKAFRYHP